MLDFLLLYLQKSFDNTSKILLSINLKLRSKKMKTILQLLSSS